jgi:hypothetical protein
MTFRQTHKIRSIRTIFPLRRVKLSFSVLSFCALGFAAAAQPALAQAFKPGLWETNNKMGAGGGKLQDAMAMVQQHLATMDPEQRKRIDGMMARQGVVISNDGVIAKMCITPEMAAKQQLPIQQHGNCSYQHAPAVGNTMAFSFSCTNPQASGEGNATSGRWLGADCGAVKPIMLPPQK